MCKPALCVLGTNSIHLQGLSHLYAYIFSQHWPFTLFPLLSHHVEWFTFYTLVLLKSSKSSWEEALDLTTPHTGRLFIQSKAQRTIVHNKDLTGSRNVIKHYDMIKSPADPEQKALWVMSSHHSLTWWLCSLPSPTPLWIFYPPISKFIFILCRHGHRHKPVPSELFLLRAVFSWASYRVSFTFTSSITTITVIVISGQ